MSIANIIPNEPWQESTFFNCLLTLLGVNLWWGAHHVVSQRGIATCQGLWCGIVGRLWTLVGGSSINDVAGRCPFVVFQLFFGKRWGLLEMIEMLKHPPPNSEEFSILKLIPWSILLRDFGGLEFEVYPYHVDEVVSQISREAWRKALKLVRCFF